MTRLRAVVVVVVVLVLGAWTCQVPTDSPGSPGATVASGVTTTGLTSLLEGEDWHYVGDATTGLGTTYTSSHWEYAGSGAQLAFRIREAGVVDLQGHIQPTASPAGGVTVFTLPAGYRPSATTGFSVIGEIPGGGGYVPVRVLVATDGTVSIRDAATDPYPGASDALGEVDLEGFVFLAPASAP